jgi:hypothetical protein
MSDESETIQVLVCADCTEEQDEVCGNCGCCEDCCECEEFSPISVDDVVSMDDDEADDDDVCAHGLGFDEECEECNAEEDEGGEQ